MNLKKQKIFLSSEDMNTKTRAVNECRLYVIVHVYYDRGKIVSTLFINMKIIYWSVCLSIRRGGNGVEGMK